MEARAIQPLNGGSMDPNSLMALFQRMMQQQGGDPVSNDPFGSSSSITPSAATGPTNPTSADTTFASSGNAFLNSLAGAGGQGALGWGGNPNGSMDYSSTLGAYTPPPTTTAADGTQLGAPPPPTAPAQAQAGTQTAGTSTDNSGLNMASFMQLFQQMQGLNQQYNPAPQQAPQQAPAAAPPQAAPAATPAGLSDAQKAALGQVGNYIAGQHYQNTSDVTLGQYGGNYLTSTGLFDPSMVSQIEQGWNALLPSSGAMWGNGPAQANDWSNTFLNVAQGLAPQQSHSTGPTAASVVAAQPSAPTNTRTGGFAGFNRFAS